MAAVLSISVFVVVAALALLAAVRHRLPGSLLPGSFAMQVLALGVLLVLASHPGPAWIVAVCAAAVVSSEAALTIAVTNSESQLPIHWWRKFDELLATAGGQAGRQGRTDPGPAASSPASARLTSNGGLLPALCRPTQPSRGRSMAMPTDLAIIDWDDPRSVNAAVGEALGKAGVKYRGHVRLRGARRGARAGL